MVETLDFDVIVVGAGPAGSSAAFTAAKNGMKVAIIEREESIAHTVRTSGVTWIDTIEEFNIPKDCYNPIRKYGFYSSNNQVLITDRVPHAAVLDVRKTYRFLANIAKNEGAKIFLKTSVFDVLKNKNGNLMGVVAASQKKEINFTAKVIIDASGFQSVVARMSNKVKQWERFGVGAEWEAKVEKLDTDTWWLMVGSQYSPAGYAWIFPVKKNVARIGVGVGKPESEIDPTEKLKQIIEKKIGPIRKLGKIEPIEFHYGLIPNEGLKRKTVYDNLMLVGDSAGQANPLVLEGIRYAIRFGRVAGNIASKAIKKGDTTEKSLIEYEEIWKKSIQAKINSASKVQSRWLGLTDKQWDREIEIIKELTSEEFIDFIKADFGLSNIIKLATHHPKLAVRQLFHIVKDVAKKD